MAITTWIALILVLGVNCEITEDEGVWVLTDENFQEALSLQPDLLVEFYAPWCGHCKTLAPEYSKAAKKLANNSPPIKIAKVDATVNTKLKDQFQIAGFPTLKYFVNKSPIEYSGGRTEDTIVSWILKRNTPSLSYFNTLEELEASLPNHKVAAVLFAQKDTEEVKTFEVVSKSIDNIMFAVCSDSAALSKFEVNNLSMVLFKQFDDKRADFIGRFTSAELTKFIDNNKSPWVVPFGDEAIELIFKKSSPALFVFSNSYSDYQFDLETLSKELKGILIISYADLRSPDNKKLSEFIGVSAASQPAAVIIDPRNGMNKYKHTGEISYSALKSFASDWKNGKVSSYLKSENVPANSFDNGVRVLVGNNFEEIVMDSNKDVLVEFYAPWCGHCKSLAPEYEKLAKEFSNVDSVVIAKMDSTANEAKGVNIKGFPTIKFYPANSKKPIDFEGDRNFEGLLQFVKKHSTAPLDVKKIEL